jgi:hypothetical protein
MFIFRIIGWIIVIWLFGSTIYSTQFHLRNYLRSKDRKWIVAKDLEAPGQEIKMNRDSFLRHIIIMQFIKLFVMAFLIYLLIK